MYGRVMSRNDDALRLAEDLMTDIELSRANTCAHVLKAMRLARVTRNSQAQEWLAFEMNGGKGNETGRAWMTRTKRWIDKEKGTGYWGSASSIQANADANRLAMTGHSAPVNLSSDYVLPAMTARARNIATVASEIAKFDRILEAIDARVYELAADTHRELTYSEVQRRLFEQIQADVDATLAAFAGSELKMIDSIAERLGSTDTPAISQAMTTCRQLFEAAADYLYPASDTPYDGIAGRTLDVKADKVKNRLNAHLHRAGVTGGRASRLGMTLNELYERVSAAVHSGDAVSAHEARYLFLATYSYIGEVLTIPYPSAD